MSTLESVKKRNLTKEEDGEALFEKLYSKYADADSSDDELPYGGKAYLARKKKGDSWACIALQVTKSHNCETKLFVSNYFSFVQGFPSDWCVRFSLLRILLLRAHAYKHCARLRSSGL